MRRREACKFHLLGRCRYGDECRYSHAADATRPLCIYFLQGFCRNGQSCPFAHALDDAYVDNVEAQIQSEGSPPDAPQQRQVDSAEHTAAASGAHPGPPALDAATTTLVELTHCSLCKYKGAAPEDLANHLRGKHPAAITQLRQLQAHNSPPKTNITPRIRTAFPDQSSRGQGKEHLGPRKPCDPVRGGDCGSAGRA